MKFTSMCFSNQICFRFRTQKICQWKIQRIKNWLKWIINNKVHFIHCQSNILYKRNLMSPSIWRLSFCQSLSLFLVYLQKYSFHILSLSISVFTCLCSWSFSVSVSSCLHVWYHSVLSVFDDVLCILSIVVFRPLNMCTHGHLGAQIDHSHVYTYKI